MRRRHFLSQLIAIAVLPLLPACARAKNGEKLGQLGHPREFWRSLVTPAQYQVLFEEATEPPGSHPLNKEKREGSFICAACYLPLFSSKTKYESGTGWPSFRQPLPKSVDTRSDFLLVVERTEYHCARCGGHQGHVFDDGPQPTGKRYCNNGLALAFVAAGDKLPALRG